MSGEPETHKLDTHELMKFIDQLTQEAKEEQHAQLSVVAGELPRLHGIGAVRGQRVGPCSGARPVANEPAEPELAPTPVARGDGEPRVRSQRSASTRAERVVGRSAERDVCSVPTAARVHVLFPPLRKPRASDCAARAALTMLDAQAQVDDERALRLPVRSALPRLLALVAVALLTCGLLSWICAHTTNVRSVRASGPPPLPHSARAERESERPLGAAGPLASPPALVHGPLQPAAQSAPAPAGRVRRLHVRAPERSQVPESAGAAEVGVRTSATPADSPRGDASTELSAERASVATLRSAQPASASSLGTERPLAREPKRTEQSASASRDLARGSRSDPAPDPLPLRRQAVDLLLAGRTRAALDYYRALLLAGEQPALVGEIVHMLEKELRACEQEGAAACGR